MSHIPFAPWMGGTRALDMVRNADGPTRSIAPLTYYSAVLAVHERLSGELWNAEAWVDLARTKLMEGDLQAAESALSQAGMMGTPDPEAPMLMAEIYLHTDRAERAHGLLRIVVEQRPRNAWAHYLLGLAFRDLGLEEEEADAYRAAVRIDPNLVQAWYRLGICRTLAKEWAEALVAYREVLRLDPSNEPALIGAGLAMHRGGYAVGPPECLAWLRELESTLAPLLDVALGPTEAVPPALSDPGPPGKKGKGDS